MNLSERIRIDVVRPTLRQMDLWSESAEEILLMIAAHESGGFVHRVQAGGGPARGLWQMEPIAYADLCSRYFQIRPEVRAAVLSVLPPGTYMGMDLLVSNDRFACAMARAHLLKVPDPLPAATDLEGMSLYCKQHWNTPAGKASPKKYLDDYRRYVLEPGVLEA